MWIYAAVLAGVTVVVLVQLNRLRGHQHPGISPEALQARSDERQAMVDDALGRVGAVAAGLRVAHSTVYSWPHFEVAVPDQAALDALQASGGVDALRDAFTQAVATARELPVESVGFDPVLGVVFQVDGS